MNTVEFLTAMWPTQGIYVIATSHPNSRQGGRDWFRHHHFDRIEDAAAEVVKLRDKADCQVFYALHTYAALIERTSKAGRPWMDVERVQSNTAFTRLYALDLDVGESKPGAPKYATREAALTALVAFLAVTKLPKPSIVFSGNGVHVYWRLAADLPSGEWQATADKLQLLCDHHKLLVDRKITIDSSRVLRPIHTLNRKDPAQPKKVELVKLVAPIELATLVASINAACAGLPEPSARRSFTGGAVGASGIMLVDGAAPPPTIKKLARACPTFRQLARDAGTASGTVWRATLELLRHTTGGEAACHKASEGHPDYDWQTTQDRLQRYQRMDLGPPRCSTLQGVYGDASPCPTCPHFGSPDSSPIAFARREPDQELPPDVPPVPEGFRRTKRGIEHETVKVVEGEEETFWITIYPYDLYPLRIVDDPLTRRKVVEWRATVPIKGDITVSLPVDAYTDENKMIGLLVHQGVTVEKRHGKKMGEYVSLYIRQLQQFAAEQQQVSNFGWNADMSRFNLSEGSYGPDGLKSICLSAKVSNAAQGLQRKGTLAGQVAALKFYDDPAYVRQQVMVAISAATPLFYLTDHYGVLVNLSGPSGASKSSALYAAAGVWGVPEKVVINGTAGGATQNARMARLEAMANLPVLLDDVTDMDPMALKQMAMGVTQPGGRIRVDREGAERAMPDNLKSTVMLLSSNPPLHSLLSQDNIAGDAGSMRTVDMPCERLSVHSKREADDYLRQLKANCGHVGPLVIQHVLRNRAAVEGMLRDATEEVERRGSIVQQERYWSTAISTAVFGARLLRQLGVANYDADQMLSWFVEYQLPLMRGTVNEAYTDPVGALQGFMADNINNLLAVSYHNGGYSLAERPKGPLVGRVELHDGRMWILVAAFRGWCVRRKLPFEAYIRDLLREKVVSRDRMDLTRHISGIDLGVAATLRINLGHADMAGTVDTGGKIIDFKGKNEHRPLVSAV